jgi:hypothetical protein
MSFQRTSARRSRSVRQVVDKAHSLPRGFREKRTCLRVEIEVDDLVKIIQGARRKDVHGVEEIVKNNLLPECRRGGDPAVARAIAGALTNEKRRLYLFGVNLTKLEEAWMMSQSGQAEACIDNDPKQKYIANRSDWSLHLEHQSAMTYLEALPQQALMRLARLNWTPRGELISALDAIVEGLSLDDES